MGTAIRHPPSSHLPRSVVAQRRGGRNLVRPAGRKKKRCVLVVHVEVSSKSLLSRNSHATRRCHNRNKNPEQIHSHDRVV